MELKFFKSVILLFSLISQITKVVCETEKAARTLLPIKIIEEPSIFLANANLQNFADPSTRGYQDQMSQLKPKHAPANFSGPQQLEELKGKCFDFTKQNYKWVVCPFQNVTQFEQSVYKPYKGILGIWREWKINNTEFKSMFMADGDECGVNGNRQTTIHLNCNDQNNETEIQNVNEPKICSYEINMRSPLACEKTDLGYTMKVFSVLSPGLQVEWNRAFSDLVYKFINEDVYQLILTNIYQRAGFYFGDKATVEEDNLLNFDSLTNEQLKVKLLECKKENKELKISQKKLSTPEH